ncbi:MAG: hypothetical protein JWM64_1541 [Frankiales bacterium]|nr:hypothetical protein [Frankiales bacterium]
MGRGTGAPRRPVADRLGDAGLLGAISGVRERSLRDRMTAIALAAALPLDGPALPAGVVRAAGGDPERPAHGGALPAGARQPEDPVLGTWTASEAAGVETLEQLDALQRLGRDFAQGLFCRPSDAAALAGWLDGWPGLEQARTLPVPPDVHAD